MSIAQLVPTTSSRVSSRWLLLGSLALNLFFVGVAAAIAVRSPAPPSWDRNVFVRVERIAATLPPADADLLRGQIKVNRETIESAQTKYRIAQDTIRETLRQDPFDAGAMRAAMANTRAARQTFDQTIQGVFAGTASQMSPAGRHALADWPPGRKSASAQQ
ncbi:MAG: periplasmic heavy metal sensor [Pseudolabrys sp.]|nr:periplasmic heavy metal sensor [Pseudolabrys sp.]MSP32328.1 periplasmic heavy metal sensor [Pseudolabrys sp.]